MKKNRLILHSSISWGTPLVTDIAIAREAGFDGIDPSVRKLQAFLDAGYSEAELTETLRGVDIPGFGVIWDIERHGQDRAALMRDAEKVIHLATIAGAKGIQVIPGPMDVQAVIDHAEGRAPKGYAGTLGMGRDEQIRILADNLRAIADMAKEAGFLIYLEPMSWTPVNRIAENLEVLARADRDNLRICIDFWHCFTAGDTPDDVARIDKSLIYGVHICDSLPWDGSVPNEVILRDVELGKGVIDLRAWTDAVKSTGYEDWWGCESMCRRLRQQDGRRVAAACLADIRALVG